MSKRPHLLATVVVQHRLIKHRNLPDEPLSGLTKVLDQSSIGRQRIARALSGDMSYGSNRHPSPRLLLFRLSGLTKVLDQFAG